VTTTGTQDARLVITGLTAAMDNMQYRVVLTNGECTATSGVFTLRVNNIVSSSAGSDVAVCETATSAMFAGTSSATGPSATGHQWRWSTSETGTYNNVPATGASGQTTTNLTVTNTNASWPPVGMTTYYRLRVSKTGCNSVDSDPIAFTRDEAPALSLPADVTLCENSNLDLTSSTATFGGNPIAITWSADVPGGTFSPDVTTLAAMYTPPVDYAGAIVITLTTADTGNACGTDTETITVTYENAPVANAGSDQSVCQSTPTVDIQLNGAISGGAVSLLWSGDPSDYDNNTLANALYTPNPGDRTAQTVTLTLTATNGLGAVCPDDTDDVVISLGNGIVLNTYTPGGGSAGTRTVCNLGNTSFAVSYDPTVAATHVWEINDGSGWVTLPVNAAGLGITGWTVVNDDNNVQLLLTGLTPVADGSQFRVMVTDRGCSATFGNFTLNVNGPVTVTTQPVNVGVCATAPSANFSAVVSNGGSGVLTYQWQFYNGTSWVNVPNTVAGYNGSNLFVTSSASFWPGVGSSVDLRLNVSVPTCSTISSDIVTLTRTSNPCGGVNLTPNFTPSQSGVFVTPGVTKDFVITIQNTLPGNSSGQIQVFVPTISGYNMIFNPTQATAVVTSGSVAVNNSSWTVTVLPSGFLLSTSNVISGNSSLNFAIQVTSTASMTSGNLTAALNPASGGQTDFSDDSKSKFVTTF
jgi:hypothetical protein